MSNEPSVYYSKARIEVLWKQTQEKRRNLDIQTNKTRETYRACDTQINQTSTVALAVVPSTQNLPKVRIRSDEPTNASIKRLKQIEIYNPYEDDDGFLASNEGSILCPLCSCRRMKWMQNLQEAVSKRSGKVSVVLDMALMVRG